MASRANLNDAQQLVDELKKTYPNRVFSLDKAEKNLSYNIKWNKPAHITLLSDTPDEKGYVKAVSVSYEISEVRECSHGKTYKTSAIGEDSPCSCSSGKARSGSSNSPKDHWYDQDYDMRNN